MQVVLLHEAPMTCEMFDRVLITGNTCLDSLESGRVVVCELLEDVSRSKAERTQSVQDGSLEA